jgi:hypothetical protein
MMSTGIENDRVKILWLGINEEKMLCSKNGLIYPSRHGNDCIFGDDWKERF